jgi:hypothetical protein
VVALPGVKPGPIRALTNERGTMPDAGVRLANDPAGALTVSLASAPFDGDQVLEESGARVFVDSNVVDELDDKALDAAVIRDGRVEFALRPRPS